MEILGVILSDVLPAALMFFAFMGLAALLGSVSEAGTAGTLELFRVIIIVFIVFFAQVILYVPYEDFFAGANRFLLLGGISLAVQVAVLLPIGNTGYGYDNSERGILAAVGSLMAVLASELTRQAYAAPYTDFHTWTMLLAWLASIAAVFVFALVWNKLFPGKPIL